METADDASLTSRTREVLGGAAGAALVVLFAASGAGAEECGDLLRASGCHPARSFGAPDAVELRILDLEHSYPWSGAEERRFGLGIESLADPNVSGDPAPAPTPSQRCVLIQCVRIGGEPEPAPQKLFTTPVTLWTATALLGGFAVGILGPIGYGIHGFRFTDERFFQYETYGGGSDKASHFVVSASTTSLLYDAYRLNRLSPDQAFALSFATSTLAGVLVEIGDGLTPYGFSAQDLTMDALGAFTEAFIKRNELDDLLGFRIGRVPTKIPPAIVRDRPLFGINYSNEIYTADMKLDGLAHRIGASPGAARFLVSSFVFLTKGYGYEPPLPERYQEVGIELGLNLPEILRAAGVNDSTWWGDFLLRALTFLRIPFTQVGAYFNLKNQKWYGPGAPYHFY